MSIVSNVTSFFCGSGYTVDWQAWQTVGTFTAVLGALGIATWERLDRRQDRKRLELRAALVIEPLLGEILVTIPGVMVLITAFEGRLQTGPEAKMLYALNLLNDVENREPYFFQLPSRYLARGNLVHSVARKFRQELEARLEIESLPSSAFPAAKDDLVVMRAIADSLVRETQDLQERCRKTILKGTRLRRAWRWLVVRLSRWCRREAARSE